MSKPTLLLYGRETCHLCHDMWADVQVFLRQHALDVTLEWVDIEDAPELEARYGLRIPVLTDSAGNELCEARIDTAALRLRLTP